MARTPPSRPGWDVLLFLFFVVFVWRFVVIEPTHRSFGLRAHEGSFDFLWALISGDLSLVGTLPRSVVFSEVLRPLEAHWPVLRVEHISQTPCYLRMAAKPNTWYLHPMWSSNVPTSARKGSRIPTNSMQESSDLY